MEIGNQKQNHKKRPTASLYMKMEAFDQFYQNYRQRYAVIPPSEILWVPLRGLDLFTTFRFQKQAGIHGSVLTYITIAVSPFLAANGLQRLSADDTCKRSFNQYMPLGKGHVQVCKIFVKAVIELSRLMIISSIRKIRRHFTCIVEYSQENIKPGLVYT